MEDLLLSNIVDNTKHQINSLVDSTSSMILNTDTTMASYPLSHQHNPTITSTTLLPSQKEMQLKLHQNQLSQPPLPLLSITMTQEHRVDPNLSQSQEQQQNNIITHQAHTSQILDYGQSVQAETLDTIQASFNNLSLNTDDRIEPHQKLHQPLLQEIPIDPLLKTATTSSYNTNFRPTPKNIVEKNLIYISEEIKSFFSRGTLLIKLISTSVILMYLFTIIVGNEQIAYSLTLIPSRLYSSDTFLWSALTFITCPFVEFHLWQVALDVIFIYLIDNLVKPLWGQLEVIRFFVIVNMSVCILSQLHYTLYASMSGHWNILQDVYIHGLSSFCGAVCVTSKQLLPGSTRLDTRYGKFKNDHIAIAALLFGTIAWSLDLIYGVYLLMFLYGVIVSWFYLRFCQQHSSSNGMRGDYSDSMAFVTFFPSFIQPLLSPVFNIIFSVFVVLKILPPVAPNMRYESVKLQITQQLTTKRHARQSSTEIKSLIQNL